MPDQIRIVDVSNNNGPNVNMATLKADGVAGVILKATQGNYYVDVDFNRNRANAQAAGLALGYYAFGDPTRCTYQEDAACFIRMVGTLENGAIPVLDIEIGDGNLSAWALGWLGTVADKWGVAPMVYTGAWFAVGRLSDPKLGQYHLWDAAYQNVIPAPYAPWSTITLWQYTAYAPYPWGPTDESLFTGTVEQFKALGKTPPAAPVPHPVAPGPTAAHYAVRVAMALRVAPVVTAPHATPVLKVGTKLTASAGWTTSWRKVRLGNLTGWALASNLDAA